MENENQKEKQNVHNPRVSHPEEEETKAVRHMETECAPSRGEPSTSHAREVSPPELGWMKKMGKKKRRKWRRDREKELKKGAQEEEPRGKEAQVDASPERLPLVGRMASSPGAATPSVFDRLGAKTSTHKKTNWRPVPLSTIVEDRGPSTSKSEAQPSCSRAPEQRRQLSASHTPAQGRLAEAKKAVPAKRERQDSVTPPSKDSKRQKQESSTPPAGASRSGSGPRAPITRRPAGGSQRHSARDPAQGGRSRRAAHPLQGGQGVEVGLERLLLDDLQAGAKDTVPAVLLKEEIRRQHVTQRGGSKEDTASTRAERIVKPPEVIFGW